VQYNALWLTGKHAGGSTAPPILMDVYTPARGKRDRASSARQEWHKAHLTNSTE